MDKILSEYLHLSAEEDFNKILTNPILDIAARVWDENRYQAFKICYKSMRVIDDLIDNRKATAEIIPQQEKEQFEKMMVDWIRMLKAKQPHDPMQKLLQETIQTFQLPLWPWERLVKAMIYDIYHDHFKSLLVFLRYTEGAAIAPASIFMHLCGITQTDSGYAKPAFDIRVEARYLALFSYFVHIMRDFEKDQKDNLNYFSHSLMSQCQVTSTDLRKAALSGNLPQNVRELFSIYHKLADYYRQKARAQLDRLHPSLEPRYQLSLELIYMLYYQIFEKIDPKTGKFDTISLLPNPDEVQAIIIQTVNEYNR